MKKYFIILTLSFLVLFKANSQDDISLRFIDASNNKIEAAIILNTIEKTEFETLKTQLESSSVFTIEGDFVAEKKFASFSFKSKTTALITDFEKLMNDAKILQLVYNNKLINSSQISQNYKHVNRTETFTNERLNNKK